MAPVASGLAIEAAVQAMLPPGAAVAWADPAVMHGPLPSSEEALIANAVDRRRREFSAGRTAARRAMVRLGYPPKPVPADALRAPLWPDGLVGSITHCEGCCLAVVALADSVAGIGIDAELHQPVDIDMLESVTSPAERRAMRRGAIEPIVLFSAKEAAFKAINPTMPDLELADIQLGRISSGNINFFIHENINLTISTYLIENTKFSIIVCVYKPKFINNPTIRENKEGMRPCEYF